MAYTNGEYTGYVDENDNIQYYGTYTWNNGDYYVGDFVDGKRTGYESYYFSNGDMYQGFFEDDVKLGQGTYYWANGNRFTAIYKSNNNSEVGILYYADGSYGHKKLIDGKYVEIEFSNRKPNLRLLFTNEKIRDEYFGDPVFILDQH